MALITCPECGKQISDKAPQCIHCGYPLECTTPAPVTLSDEKIETPQETAKQLDAPTNDTISPSAESIDFEEIRATGKFRGIDIQSLLGECDGMKTKAVQTLSNRTSTDFKLAFRIFNVATNENYPLSSSTNGSLSSNDSTTQNNSTSKKNSEKLSVKDRVFIILLLCAALLSIKIGYNIYSDNGPILLSVFLSVVIFIGCALFILVLNLVFETDEERAYRESLVPEKIDVATERKKWLTENNITSSGTFTYLKEQQHKDHQVIFDKEQQKMIVFKHSYRPIVLSFSDIVGCEIRENGATTGSIGRAIIGGAIAGGAGAIIGSNTAKEKIVTYNLAIICKDLSNPEIELDLISSKMDIRRDSDAYRYAAKFANEVSSCVKGILT